MNQAEENENLLAWHSKIFNTRTDFLKDFIHN